MSVFSRRAVVVDRWDVRRFDDLLAHMPDLAAEGRLLAEAVPQGGPELWADIFAVFDLVSPRLVDPFEMDPALMLNRTVVETALGLPEFDRLRIWSQGDAVTAAEAAMSMRPTLEAIHDRAATIARLAAAAAARRQELAELSADEDDTDLVGTIQAADEQLQRERDLEEPERMLMLRASLADAARAAERDTRLARAWDGDGEILHLPAERRLALARRMRTPAFEKMAALFGALEALLDAEQRLRPSAVPDDDGPVEYGRDLARALPSARMLLADPDLEYRFFADYAEGRLPQVGRKGAETLGRGGIVLCCDNSKSMRRPPTKEHLAKAVALVLLHLCRRQRRSFYGIHFASADQVKVFDFSRPYGVDQVLDFAEFFWNGYTDFVPPLQAARQRLASEYDRRGVTEADIVFVTDGQAHMTPVEVDEHVAEMERIGAKTWGILLGEPCMEPLRTVCGGRVTTIADVLNPAKNLGALWAGVN